MAVDEPTGDQSGRYVHYFVAEPQRLFWSAVDNYGPSAKRLYGWLSVVLICGIIASSTIKATFPCERSGTAGQDVWSQNTCTSIDKIISYGVIAPVGGFAYAHYKIPEQILTKAIPEAVRYAIELSKSAANWLQIRMIALFDWICMVGVFVSESVGWIVRQVSEPVQVVVDWFIWILSIPFRIIISVVRLVWFVLSAVCVFAWTVVSSVGCFIADGVIATWTTIVVPACSFVADKLRPVGPILTLWRSTFNSWFS